MTKPAATSPCDPAFRRRGRPVQIDPARREELVLGACLDLLSERGLEDVTMSAIADRSGMSKRTIYGLFDSREALLAACISRLGRSIFRPLMPADRARPLSERLRRLLTIHSFPGSQAYSLDLLRALLSEVRVLPALARKSCEEGRDVLERNVAAELTLAVQDGELNIPAEQIDLASRILIDMAFENPIPKMLKPDLPRPSPAQIEARRDWAIEIFLRGLAGGADASGDR